MIGMEMFLCFTDLSGKVIHLVQRAPPTVGNPPSGPPRTQGSRPGNIHYHLDRGFQNGANHSFGKFLIIIKSRNLNNNVYDQMKVQYQLQPEVVLCCVWIQPDTCWRMPHRVWEGSVQFPALVHSLQWIILLRDPTHPYKWFKHRLPLL